MKFDVENLTYLAQSLGITAILTYFTFYIHEECGKVEAVNLLHVSETVSFMDE